MTAVRPPEYFPRLAYLAHAAAVDTFLLADTFQYSRQSFQNRTPVRTPDRKHWLSIPLLGGQHGLPIAQVQIDYRSAWPRTHWRTLTYNYGSAPFFEHYAPEVHDLIHRRWPSLGDLTCASTELLLGLLGLSFTLRRASLLHPPPRTLADCARLAPSGLLLSRETLHHDGAFVRPAAVLDYEEAPRRQNFPGFTPGLSALDLLFNHGPHSATLLRAGMRLRQG